MFNDYKKQPREENWQNIKSKLNEDRAYEKLSAKFDGFTSVPPPQNWGAIQNKMQTPKPTFSRRIFAVAASLAMLFFIISEGNNSPTVNFAEFHKGISLTEDLAFNLCKDDPTSAVDIVATVIIPAEKKKIRKKRKKKQVNQKRLLDIILADDEDITAKVDSLLIAELLSPANILPEESMFASIGGTYFYYRQGNTFKVMYTLPEVDYRLQIPIDTVGPFMP